MPIQNVQLCSCPWPPLWNHQVVDDLDREVELLDTRLNAVDESLLLQALPVGISVLYRLACLKLTDLPLRCIKRILILKMCHVHSRELHATP